MSLCPSYLCVKCGGWENRRKGGRKEGRKEGREEGRKDMWMHSQPSWVARKALSRKPELDACSVVEGAHTLTELTFTHQPLRASTGPGTEKLSQGSKYKARVLHQT